ncbi:MAG: DUF4159 domain-containing protein [Planctomycetes bacterium]|nr:DUF4159 domain-containing protein [Planctomycetota bacterium]
MRITAARFAAVWVAAVCLAWASPARGDFTGQQIDENIQKLADYFLSQQQADGTFSRPQNQQGQDVFVMAGGKEAAALLGLGFAGVTADDDRVQRGLDALMYLKPDTTEVLATRVAALLLHLNGMKPAQRKRAETCLAEDIKTLVTAQDDTGKWGYRPTPTRSWNVLTTCLAARSLYEAQRSGIRLKSGPFEAVMKTLMENQSGNGGWVGGYATMMFSSGRDRVGGAETASAMASLLELRQAAAMDAGCPCTRGKSKDGWGGIDESAERAYNWLAENFKPGENIGHEPTTFFRRYWLYCCGRAMMAGGYKYLGPHDWYRQGVAELMSRGIPGRDENEWLLMVETAYRIGFLKMCREPVLVNKLKFHGQWNQHPHDALSLARLVSELRKRPHRCQVLEPKHDLIDFQEAPLMMISSEDDVILSAQEKQLLRRYTDTGGTILCEATCGNMKAMRSFERLIEDVWPEWKLNTIDKEDAFWTADAELTGRLPVLRSLNDGVRTFLFFSPRDLTCSWAVPTDKKNLPDLQVGQNLVAVATDMARLPGRYDEPEPSVDAKYPGQQLKRGSRESVKLARIKHKGCWDAGRNYGLWSTLSVDLATRVAMTIKETEPLEVGGTVPEGLGFAYLAGRGDLNLGEGGAEWLKKYLADGGFLLAEATCGDKAFDEKLRALLAEAGLTLKPLEAESPLLSGDLFGAKGYAMAKVGYTRTLRQEREGKDDIVMFRIEREGRLVGLYSPVDVMYSQAGYRAFGNRGYAAADARALATNIALLMSVK